ncbi:hypothetical protein AB0K89_05340 [Streptomyces cinnamoneus]|uniref:hypothetical protein n=1 Tax=Streptomyces cinnamoneus TaxID=53446 RepID=UPI0034171748
MAVKPDMPQERRRITTFEMLTLDTAIEYEPPAGDYAVLRGKELRIAIQEAFDTALVDVRPAAGQSASPRTRKRCSTRPSPR